DGGRSFGVQTFFPGTSMAGGWSDGAIPTVASDGTLYLARAEADGPALYASHDGAQSFQRTLAWHARGPNGWLFATPTVDAAGTVYVTTVEQGPGGTRAAYAASRDGGRTFSPPREL